MDNKALLGQIRREKFDLAVMDGAPPARIFYIIPYKYDIPVITLSSFLADPWDSNFESIVSVEPFIGSMFSKKMNFFQRLANLVLKIVLYNMKSMLGIEPDEMVRKYVPEKSYISLSDLFKQSKMFMNDFDIYTLDYPRISAPHYIYIGNLGKMSAKPLSSDLEEFVSDPEKGTIIITFGQGIKEIPDVLLKKIFLVCTQLPDTHFVIRNGVEVTLPVPSKVMKWIPQNDLLGHPNVKVFMSHAGTNGVKMAINFGKPMILAPVTGLEYNVLQVTSKQYGKKIDLLHDSADDIVEVILEVLENPVYTQKVEEAMRMSQALPQANDTVAYRVDHILKYGSNHIRTPYMDMPLYKLLMLDILLFINVAIILFVFVTYKCYISVHLKINTIHNDIKQNA